MSTMRALVILALGLSACATPTFRYRPEPPLADGSISADYMLMADRLRVEIDTGGYRLLDAQILKVGRLRRSPADGRAAAGGQRLERRVRIRGGRDELRAGRSGRRRYRSGHGDSHGSGTRVQGTTVLYFALDQVGPAPWRLSATIAETNPAAVIVLPPR